MEAQKTNHEKNQNLDYQQHETSSHFMPKVDKSSGLVENFLQNAAESIQEVKFKPSIKAYKPISEDKVDWKQLALVGITREQLGEKNMNKLLNYQKSDLLPVAGTFENKEGQRVSFYSEGKLKLKQNQKTGKYDIGVEYKNNKELNLESYIGYKFSEQEKENLKLYGNAGAAVNIQFKDGQPPVSCIVGIDQELNRITFLPKNKARVQEEVFGVKLTEKQISALKNGANLHIKKMTSPRTGRQFSGIVSLDPAKNNIKVSAVPKEIMEKQKAIFLAEKAAEKETVEKATRVVKRDADGVPTHLYGKELTQEQMDTMRPQQGDKIGPAILVNAKDKQGEDYQVYVRVDKNNKSGLSFSADGSFIRKQSESIAKEFVPQVDHNNNGIRPANSPVAAETKIVSGQSIPKPKIATPATKHKFGI